MTLVAETVHPRIELPATSPPLVVSEALAEDRERR